MKTGAELPPPDCLARIEALCVALRPRTMLLVGPQNTPGVDLSGALPDCAVEAHAPEALSRETRRFDLTLVIGALETLERHTALGLVARLRDLNSRHLVVVVDTESVGGARWREADWLAMGMRRLAGDDARPARYGIYGFSMADYKTTPDWLNSRFWAHPERYGKARW